MATFTLELIASDAPEEQILPMTAHVQKRMDRFIYTNKIKDSSVPIVYLEMDALDSWKNLQLVDRTYSIPTNSLRMAEKRISWDSFISAAIVSPYKELAITNVLGLDEFGAQRPLFFRHDLPVNTVECDVSVIEAGNRIDMDTGFEKVLSKDVLYTNYRNYFDPDTGAYRLYFVVSVDSEGVSTHALLNPVPVAKLAGWEDIDLEEGTLKTGYPVYSRERNTSGYTFYMNQAERWYTKPIEASLIKPVLPTGRLVTDSWYVKFTYAEFSTLVNDKLRRYHMPEYNLQPFSPSKPYVFSAYRQLLRVNSNVLSATRNNLKIDPSQRLHLEVHIFDVDSTLVKVLSTDTTKEGQRYSQTNLFIETDKIASWDNTTGLIVFGLELHADWSFKANYYYEANDLEYTRVSLNPLENPDALNRMFVFYMIPNVDDNDSAIHHLEVTHDGTIVACSQAQGRSYPNLQLLNEDGTYNINTVIGTKYASEVNTDVFLDTYTVGFDNDNAYYVLAEAVVLDRSLAEDTFVLDVRRPGNVLVAETAKEAMAANPKIAQSHYGYGELGQDAPKNAVMVLHAPLSLLEDYGGVLSQNEAEELLKTYMPAAGYAVITWEYPKVELSVDDITADQVDLTWTWEGPNYTYKLWRRSNVIDQWQLVHSEVDPAEGSMIYIDTDTVATDVFHYAVSIVEDGIEYPKSDTTSVKVV